MAEERQPTPNEKRDFFISRAGADAAWAQWIAWQLEANHYTVVLQDWDFGPGIDFIQAMQRALAQAERTIAVISPRYLQSEYTAQEWSAAFYKDPSGQKGLLLPICVEECDVEGILGPRVHLNLAGLDRENARDQLLAWIERTQRERGKPAKEPAYPGGKVRSNIPAKPEPAFPGHVPLLYGLPPRNPNFTGREAFLKELRDSLSAGRSAAVTTATRQVAAHGLGGTGKSQLAIEYAWRWASDYSWVIWLRAEIPETLGADFDALADELGLFDGDKPAEQALVIRAVRKHLEEKPGWLLIFDNAPEPAALEHAVPRAGGQVIFTSRYTAWGKDAVPLALDVWPPEEAEQFLLRRVRARGEQQDAPKRSAAAELAEELGWLPLALEQAAAYCERSSVTLSDYLLLFRENRLELFRPQVFRADQGTREVITVTTTWSLSLDRIRDNENCPEAAALFSLCTFFAPDRIPLEMIRAGAHHLPEPLCIAARSDVKVNSAIANLLRYSLVSVEGSGKGRVLSVHRLLQEVSRERLSEDEKSHWVTAALEVINQAFPDNSHDVRAWPACGQLVPHAIAALGHAGKRQIRKIPGRFLNQLADYYWGRAEYAKAEPLYQRAIAIRKNELGPDHPDTGTSLNHLADLYVDQARYEEAEPLYRRALALRENVLGPDHPETGTSLNNLGNLYRKQFRYAEAEPLYQRALAIFENTLGPDHPSTAVSLNNLGLMYEEQGRYAEAEPLYQRALAIWETALGPDHPHTATALHNLAGVYKGRGYFVEAEQFYQRAIAVRENALGPDHPDAASSLHNLAGLYADLGRFAEAEPLYQRALAICERALGWDHPWTTTTRKYYVRLLRATGRDAEGATLEAAGAQAEGAAFQRVLDDRLGGRSTTRVREQ
jgi:tetratricopeptide (TPR) repeat protein